MVIIKRPKIKASTAVNLNSKDDRIMSVLNSCGKKLKSPLLQKILSWTYFMFSGPYIHSLT